MSSTSIIKWIPGDLAGNVRNRYEINKRTASDINEHLSDLCAIANLGSVTEFGVRAGVSTSAFIAGSSSRVTSYDVMHHPSFDLAFYKAASEKLGVDFNFIVADVLEVEIEETDVLFIDTLHTYPQLKAELERHHAKVRKTIVLHDTETFGLRGEDGAEPGLQKAVVEFLLSNREWYMLKHKTNNNGLTILNRLGVLEDAVSHSACTK